MAWTVLAESHLLESINDAELQQYRTIHTQAGQSDPVAGTLENVSNLVRGYVNQQNDLEATGIPPSLITAAVDIAIYRLAKRVSDALAEKKKPAFDEAMELLAMVAKGEFAVEDAETVSEGPEVAPVEIVSAPARKTTRTKLEGL